MKSPDQCLAAGSGLMFKLLRKNDMNASTMPVIFNFDNANIRVVMIDGQPWFVATDVCAALKMTVEATRRLDDDEKGLTNIQTPGGEQQLTIINESGLYSLVLRSRKPEAKRFKKWVTSEVLPSIRKTGAYSAYQPGDIANPAYYQECRDEMFKAINGLAPGAIVKMSEEAQQKIADGFLTDILMSRRWLVTFGVDGKPAMSLIGKRAAVINPDDAVALRTLINEYVPYNLVGEVIEAAHKRVLARFESTRMEASAPRVRMGGA